MLQHTFWTPFGFAQNGPQRISKAHPKPRYLMGVGYPLDLLVCTALGVDMYDCVWPCRTARFGNAIVSSGMLSLKRTTLSDDLGAIDPECACFVCKKYTRAYLSGLFGTSPLGAHLVTYHNTIAHWSFPLRHAKPHAARKKRKGSSEEVSKAVNSCLDGTGHKTCKKQQKQETRKFEASSGRGAMCRRSVTKGRVAWWWRGRGRMIGAKEERLE
jgi:hypothetical protein